MTLSWGPGLGDTNQADNAKKNRKEIDELLGVKKEAEARIKFLRIGDGAVSRYGRRCWPALPVFQVVNTMQYV